MSLILVLSSCFNSSIERQKCFENEKTEICINISSVNEKEFKFVTRSAGIEFTRGYIVKLEIDDRDAIELIKVEDMNQVPSVSFIENKLDSFTVEISPDGTHFAVLNKNFEHPVRFFHLLKKGNPFPSKKYDTLYTKEMLEDFDWKELPSPINIAKQYLSENRRDTGDCYVMGNSMLWDAIQSNISDDNFDMLLIEYWPEVIESHKVFDEFIKDEDNLSQSFLDRIFEKSDSLFKNSESVTLKVNAIKACMLLGDDSHKQEALQSSVSCWPNSPYIEEMYRADFETYPDSLQQKIFDKAILYANNEESAYYKKIARAFINDFAPCDMLKELIKEYKYTFTLREECKDK